MQIKEGLEAKDEIVCIAEEGLVGETIAVRKDEEEEACSSLSRDCYRSLFSIPNFKIEVSSHSLRKMTPSLRKFGTKLRRGVLFQPEKLQSLVRHFSAKAAEPVKDG